MQTTIPTAPPIPLARKRLIKTNICYSKEAFTLIGRLREWDYEHFEATVFRRIAIGDRTILKECGVFDVPEEPVVLVRPRLIDLTLVYSPQAVRLMGELNNFDIEAMENTMLDRIIVGHRLILEYLFNGRK